MIKIRKAITADSGEILLWRNDPETRQLSFNSEPIPEERHRDWFAKTLNSPDRILYIAENEKNEKAGVVRMDVLGPGVAEININLAPAMRGKGYGADLIKLACRTFNQEKGTNFVIARVKSGNEASVKAFGKAGFCDLFNYQDRGRDAEVKVMGYQIA